MSPQHSTRLQRAGTVALATSVMAVMLAGTARAYWSPNGTGAGSSATGTVTISVTVTGVSGLFPGGSVPATVKVKNTSSAAHISLFALSQSGPTTVQTAGKGSCNASAVSFAAGTLPATSLDPGQSVTASGTVAMTTSAADGCQGATFALPLLATARTS